MFTIRLNVFGEDEVKALQGALSGALDRAEVTERDGATKDERVAASDLAGNLDYLLRRLADEVAAV